MKKIHSCLIVAAVGLLFAMPVMAVEDADTEDIVTLSGQVSEIREDKISVSKYNWDVGDTETTDFKIDPDVILENIDSLDEVNEDDAIEVAYVIKGVKGDSKVAKKIIINPEVKDEDESETCDAGDYDYKGDAEEQPNE